MASAHDVQYRTYQTGDEDQLADLFNRAFQSNGGGFMRTPKSWLWRYAQEPGFRSEAVQIAEYRGRIVGSVIAGETEAVFFGKKYHFGTINDVATHPEFFGKGIARQLMERAHQYLDQQGVDFDVLDADPNGHPRAKLYLPMGYSDYQGSLTAVKVVKASRLVKDTLLGLAALPFAIEVAHLRQLATPRFRSGRFDSKIVHQKRYPAFRDAFNRILPQIYDGYRLFTPERWAWAREAVPAWRFLPTYAVVREGRKIVAGATVIHQNMYSIKASFKIRLGLVQDLFVDWSAANTPANLEEIYDLLHRGMGAAATKRDCGILLWPVTPTDRLLKFATRRNGGFVIPLGAVHMFRNAKCQDQIPPPQKPLFLFPEDTMAGLP